MSGREAIKLVAAREVRERVRARAFRVSTLLLVIGVVAVVGIMSYTSGDDAPESASVSTFGAEAERAFNSATRAAEEIGLSLELDLAKSPRSAREALGEGSLDAAVTSSRVWVSAGAPDGLSSLLQAELSEAQRTAALTEAGLEPDEARRLAQTSGDVTVVEISRSEQDDSGTGIALIVTILLYIAIFSAGYAVSSGIVEEKSSRVVELLLTTMESRQLLAGKVIGIGIVSLAQVLAVVTAGLAAVLIFGDIDLPSATWSAMLLSIVYFILGFAFYGCLFAVAGSIVSRQEDSQSTTAPIMGVLILAYLVSFNVIEDADSTLSQVLTFLPPFTPMIAPAREAVGSLSTVDLIASIAVMSTACVVLIRAAGRIYERSVLRMGAPMKLREALRFVRN